MVERDTQHEASDSADGDEFRLEPIVEKGEGSKLPSLLGKTHVREFGGRNDHVARYRKNPHTALYANDATVPRTSIPPQLANIGHRDNVSPVASCSERDYSSIKSLQKYIRWFGYLTLVLGPLFLLLRFVHLVFFSTEDLGTKFPAFLSYSFWVAVSSAFMSATFFASSEFFQLFIDIQSDTFTESQTSPTGDD